MSFCSSSSCPSSPRLQAREQAQKRQPVDGLDGKCKCFVSKEEECSWRDISTEFDRPLNEGDCMPVQPLPVSEAKLVKHPHSLAENSTRTSKSAVTPMISSNPEEIERCIDDLPQHRNAKNSRTHDSSAKLFKSCMLQTHLVNKISSELRYYKSDYQPFTGIIIHRTGGKMVKILDLDDHSAHSRHVDQLKVNEGGDSNFGFDHSLINPDSVEN
ncbi:hypothetical protein Smp_158710 [Schistosoma mansoni]|uniref:Uncharacterized protein n=1 Tax=Schistosoma mansoni TaxID=6183 RepID=G4LZ76_SCHMA|nr:hypothetical protein Smp_158710 [Schistosoma mansoni]|eukprot:XP_018646551.1 hypothetical protein Smp_158710 [Schistosoma mansoni]